MSARTDPDTKRGNSFSIDPRLIIVDFEASAKDGGNPRTDYGTPEEWAELKSSIKKHGVLQNIKVFIDDKGNKRLSHGYRRMKAVLELIAEGEDIKSIGYDEVYENEEQTIINHFILNTGKPLTDIEKAEALMQLSVLTGIQEPAKLAEMVHMSYQKVAALMSFMQHATTKTKDRLKNKTISFDTAYKLANTNKNSREQNKELEEGIKKAEESGSKKVLQKHIPSIRATLSVDTQLGMLIGDATEKEDTDHEFLIRLRTLIGLIRDGAPYQEQLGMFALQTA